MALQTGSASEATDTRNARRERVDVLYDFTLARFCMRVWMYVGTCIYVRAFEPSHRGSRVSVGQARRTYCILHGAGVCVSVV